MNVNDHLNARVDFGPAEPGVNSGQAANSGPEASPPRRSLVPDRVGRRQLDAARCALAPDDHAVLASLASVRLATTIQLARLHFADRRTITAGQWACRASLRKLTELGLVTHLDRRVGGRRAGSASYVWRLRSAGWRILDASNRIYVGRKEPSLFTLDHTLAIAEVLVRLRELERAGSIELIEVTPEPAAWRTYLNAGGGVATLKPDLFAVTAGKVAEFEDVWFIEVDRATESPNTILRKAAQYETYRRTGKEQLTQGTFPKVLWLTPDQRRADQITATLSKSRGVQHLAVPMGQLATVVSATSRVSHQETL